MRQIVKSALVGVLNAFLIASAAFGQGGVANYPQTVPAQTLVGRLGISPGPTSAIPISQLAAVFGAKQSVTTNAKCDGATDDTAAINTDLAQGGYWTLPPNKTCNVTQLNITVSGTRLSGSGFNTSIVQGTTANVPVINISAGLTSIYLNDFQVTNNKTASSGSYGIKYNGDCQYCVLDNIFVQKQYVGIAVQSAGISYMHRVLSQYNLSNGVVLTNSAASGTIQWDLNDVFSGQNVGAGFLVTTGSAGPTAITLGNWHNIRTFANSGRGISVSCSSGIPCNGFRLSKGFVGQDGDHEILLDTYGGLHFIGGVTYVELSSTGATGPTLGTPASHAGDGIRVTANNTDVTISETYVNGNWNNGINSSATVSTNISATEISNNGVYGLFSGNCALLTVTSAVFVSNATANLNCNTNNGSQIIAGSMPLAINTIALSTITGLGTNVATVLAIAKNASGGIMSPTPTRAGDVAYWNGSAWTSLAGNNSGTNCFSENSSGVPAWAACSGGSGTPGGSNTQVQYNNSGAFGGISGATTDGTTLTLVAPVLGTPASVTLTNAGGTAASLTAGTATNAVNSGITNDIATNATMFPAWVTANTGNLPLKVTSTKLTFNPSTGALSSTSFTGAGTGLTGTAASLTAGNVTTIVVGTTTVTSGAGNGPLYDSGGGVLSTSTAGTNGQLYLGVTGSGPQMASMSQDCTITNAGVITCLKTNNVSFTGNATAAAGQTLATATNDNAAAGNLGEIWQTYCPSENATVTITIATPAVVTYTGHAMTPSSVVNSIPTAVCPIVFTTSSALPTGITAGTTYWAKIIDANTFNIATTAANAIAGTFITTTGSQSGTQTGTVGVQTPVASQGTPGNIMAMPLTAGDWDVQCTPTWFNGNGNAPLINYLDQAISTSSATLDQTNGRSTSFYGVAANIFNSVAGAVFQIATPVVRVPLSGTSNVFCVAQPGFSGATTIVGAAGFMRARRAR